MREYVKKISDFFDWLGSSRTIDEDVVLCYEQEVKRSQIAELIERGSSLILDAGCGSGRDMIVISKLFVGEYVGIDISLQSLLAARERALRAKLTSRVSLVRGDLNYLPFRDQAFDQIICSEVLEHIPSWKRAIKELYRVLKFRGTFIISTPNSLSIYYPQKLHLEKKHGIIHPYDQWKNYFLIKRELKKYHFVVADVRGACILPGYICYTEFGKKLIRPLLPFLKRIEKCLFSKTPLRYFGYIIIVKAIKVYNPKLS